MQEDWLKAGQGGIEKKERKEILHLQTHYKDMRASKKVRTLRKIKRALVIWETFHSTNTAD